MGIPEGYMSLDEAFSKYQQKRRPVSETPNDYPPGFDAITSNAEQMAALKSWYDDAHEGSVESDARWAGWIRRSAEADRKTFHELLQAFAKGELKLLYCAAGQERLQRIPKELFVKVLQDRKYENLLEDMFGITAHDEPPQCLQFLPDHYECLNGRMPFLASQEFDVWLDQQQPVLDGQHTELTDSEKRALENLKAINGFLRANYPDWPSRECGMSIRKMAYAIVRNLDKLAQNGQMSCKPYKYPTVRGLFSNQNSQANRLADLGHIDPFWRN